MPAERPRLTILRLILCLPVGVVAVVVVIPASAMAAIVLVRFDMRHALSLVPERRIVERSPPALLALALV